MTSNSAAARWWENYLVRYFMPSIAGIAIVAWLITIGPSDLRETLFFGKAPNSIDAPTLTLLVLYGNLFCYVASYPVLCFHTTRVIDFTNYSWRAHFFDGYVMTIFFSLTILCTTLTLTNWNRIIALFAIIFCFSIGQLIRIHLSLKKIVIKFLEKNPTSSLYAFHYALANRRGNGNRTTTTESSVAEPTPEDDSHPTETITEVLENRWKLELIESYRHMREHGNSGFIFLLELILAAGCYGVVALPNVKGSEALSIVAILLALWSMPAIFVHMLGQHLERRYSLFDRRLNS